MRKIMPMLAILVMGILILSGFGLAAVNINYVISENHPPNAPEIRGPMYFIPTKLYNYTFNATDPDADNVSYEIDWGDGTSEKWIGPYASGEEIIRSHTYFITHTTLIKARAKDTQGAIGEWGSLIPDSKDKQMTNPLNLQFLARFMERFLVIR
jgi:hypothetical protein